MTLASGNAFLPPTITSAVGFLGIMFTLWWNSRQTRKTKQEEKENERQVLRVALKAELDQLIRVIDSERTYCENFDHAQTYVPFMTFFTIYESNIPKLGLLSPNEVRLLTEANYKYEEEMGYLSRLGSYSDAGPGDQGGNILYDLQDSDKRENVGICLWSIINSAQAASTAISNRLEDSGTP